MMTSEQYRKSLGALNLHLSIRGAGKTGPADYPAVCRSRDAIAGTYEMAQMPEYEEVMVATSHITGARINRFNHVSQTIDDMITEGRLISLFTGNNGGCSPRKRGMDALHTLSIMTDDIDTVRRTNHHNRFLRYLEYIQEDDLVCDGSFIDPLGGRWFPPHRHPNADLLLHAVGETANGIVVRGTKACGMSALGSHELMVIPTMPMTKQDRIYAVSFALPSDAEGITFIIVPDEHARMRPEYDIIRLATTAFKNYEILCVFDDVVVPWERIFMYRECDFSQQLTDLLRFSFCFDA